MEVVPERVVSPRLFLRRWQPEDVLMLRAAIQANLEHLRPWMLWIALEPVSDDDRRDLIRSWESDWATGCDIVFGSFAGDTLVGG